MTPSAGPRNYNFRKTTQVERPAGHSRPAEAAMGPFWQPICAVVDYRCSGAVQQSRPLRAVVAQFPDLGAWPPPNSLRNQKMASRSAVLSCQWRGRDLWRVPAPAPPGGPGPEAGSPGSAPRGRGSAALKRPSTVAGRVHKSLNSRATGRSEGRRELSRQGAIVRSGLLASAALSGAKHYSRRQCSARTSTRHHRRRKDAGTEAAASSCS